MNIDEILSTLKDNLANQGLDLPAGVDATKVADIAGNTVLSSFSQQAGQGNFNGIMEMFSGSETTNDNPVMAGISPDLIQQLSGKLGIDSATASGITSKILPLIMNTFNQKAGSGEINIQSIIGQFQNGGIGNLIQGFLGADESKPQNSSKSSGLLGILKGLFGK